MKWDLTKIYKNDDEVQNDINSLEELTKEVLKYKDHLMENSETLEQATNNYYQLVRKIDKLIVYSNMLFHEDMSISKNETLVGKLDVLTDEISEKLAFYTPELLKSDYEEVLEYE